MAPERGERQPDRLARRERAARRAAVRRRRLGALVAVAGAALLAGVLVSAGASNGGGGPPRAPGAPPPPDEPVHLTVEVNGDLLIHSPVWYRAQALAGGRGYDFRPLLREIRPFVRGADLAICHVETPMSPRPPQGYPVFNTPPALARAIRWTGWDACDTASNHSLDQGQYGINQTGIALDRAGVRHTGSFPSPAAQRRIMMLEAKGVKIAYLAYTTITNGIPLPHPWSLNLGTARRILADARRARRAGAQAVIVNLHWGVEYQSAPSPSQVRLARVLVRSPAITAVVGQHVHVVQPIRAVGGKMVVFGEGNLLSNQTAACCPAASQDGIIALLRMTIDDRGARVTRVDYVPVYVRHPDFTVVPVAQALRRGEGPASELRASWRRTVSVVGRDRRHAPLR
ncbi:MAG: CapA family protein [Solirubrobacteraceae bacterium]